MMAHNLICSWVYFMEPIAGNMRLPTPKTWLVGEKKVDTFTNLDLITSSDVKKKLGFHLYIYRISLTVDGRNPAPVVR